MSKFGTFFTELRRRKVWLVGGVYIVAAWIILQVSGSIESAANLPDWTDTLVLVLLGLGLPLAIILAWAQETQAGTKEVTDSATGIAAEKGISIAVLPFDNLSGEDEFGYLADGLVDEVITILAQNPRFFVIGRNTTFTYKGQAVNLRDVGRELGVAYVIEGSVRKAGDQMRINVQLIEAETGAHAWSDRFVFDVAEIFDIQDQMIEGIAGHLGDEVLAAEISKLTARPTDDLGAWELFIRTMDWRKTGPSAAEPLLREALKRDPDFAVAMATLSILLVMKQRATTYDQAVLDEALALGERALELSPSDPLVMGAVSTAFQRLGLHDRAIQLAEAVLQKAPGDARSYAVHAGAKMAAGDGEAALTSARRALELSPRDIAASGFLNVLSAAELQLGNLEASLEHVRNAEKFAGNAEARWTLGLALANILALTGDADEAKRVFEKAKHGHPAGDLNSYMQFTKMNFNEELAERMLQGLRTAGIVE